MSSALRPALTALDVRVLHAVPRHRGVRIAQVVKATGGRETADTVRSILRGLERTGYVTGAGGWWRRHEADT